MQAKPTSRLLFGLATPAGLWRQDYDERRTLLAEIHAQGFDHVYMADHVSFRDGSGNDGFVEVAALAGLHPSIGVMISIYLLPLRHPLPVARQLATMHKVAPGRMVFGVGIGGEDRHETEVCGVDPRTRGRRTNESLQIIRALMRGETLDFDGDLFQLQQARIKPAIEPPIPILVGGRSDAALVRTARYGEGWIGVWCSPNRFQQAVAYVSEQADRDGRGEVHWLHGYQPWVGVAETRAAARRLVSEAMEGFYKVPFEKFERYTPYGTPAEVAEQLQPYVEAGARLMNLKVVAADDAGEVQGGGEILRLLRSENGG